MNEIHHLTSRVTELEFQMAHLQRTNDQLNEVITEQTLRMEQLQRQVIRLESVARDLKQAAESTPDPLDEKPPHY